MCAVSDTRGDPYRSWIRLLLLLESIVRNGAHETKAPPAVCIASKTN